MMTLSKLAKLAHVSLSTASKAFSMSSGVNEETMEMIFDLARKHDCFKKFYNAKYPRFHKKRLYNKCWSVQQIEPIKIKELNKTHLASEHL